MEVAHLDPVIGKIVGQVLGHPLGQRRNQHPFVPRSAQADFRHQIVHLGDRRTNLDLRIHQAGGPHHLLHYLAAVLALEICGRRRYEHRLRHDSPEFVEPQRPVVQRRRQSEAVLHQVLLPRTVALVHSADLRDR